MDGGHLEHVALVLSPFHLKGLYPERTTFHISEAISFWAVMARYRCLLGDLDAAAEHLADLQLVAPNHTTTRAIEEMVTRATRALTAIESPAATPGRQRPFRQGSHSPKKDRNRKGRLR
jgi:hypothetical protein